MDRTDGVEPFERAFLALALVGTGQEREAVSFALAALAALADYARLLAETGPEPEAR